MKSKHFNKTKLATTLSIILSTATVPAVMAEEANAEEIEVIQVTGMRSSIKESTRLKRDATGVVDAISAEDIGKFPDTNLAESLQRITGVSIDRSNGEGSKVTVRGFGPDYNMVTLNGRTMPASSLPAGGGTPNSRAFDFANIAAESVQKVEVYKTGRASIATGGIGATIDISTFKPLENAGTKASFQAGAVSDTTNRTGDDVTPEFSSLLSWTNEEETFGASLTSSYSKRDSAAAGGFVNQWRTSAFDGNIPQAAENIVINNGPSIGQLYSMPSDLRYSLADRERTRTNAQLTLQYRPMENLTATLDYTYAGVKLEEQRSEQSIWMDTFKSNLTFDDNVVKTPIYYREDRFEQMPRDLGLAQQELKQKNENDSIGLNLNYEVNDYVTVIFDAHSSTAESSPDAAYGSWINAGLGANISNAQGADFSKDLPTMFVDFDDCRRDGSDGSVPLNCNGVLDQDDVGTSILDMNYAHQKSDIKEYRLMAEIEFENGSIDFGVESRSMESHSEQGLTRHTMGNWGVENPGELPAGFLTPTSLVNQFDDINTHGAFDGGFTAKASDIGKWAAGEYGFNFVADGAFATNRKIKEDITAAFVQVKLDGELGKFPFHVVAGLRYEDTDITSSANIDLPSAVAWEGNNDFNVRFGSAKENFSLDSSYDHFLPSFDFDIEFMENLITRASFSTTIARPTYDNLSSAATVSGPGAPTLIPGAAPATASTGNPALIPLESDNVDFSVEWYFDDTSYVSIGYYEKRVRNFIGVEPVTENFYGLRDATAGPRAIAAMAELEARGLDINDSNLFQMVAATENGVDFDSMSYEQFEIAYDILPNSSDPLMEFTAQKPVNNKDAKIDGFEFAIQHFFGESGFGVQANYTTVDGDVDFKNDEDPSVTQFALVGLSDTANLVLLYEKDDFQARIAYNWRDKFLNSAARYVNEPAYTEEYNQIDVSVGYQYSENLSFSLEGINITEEDTRQHGRTSVQLWNIEEQGARYAVKARYTF